MKTVSSRIFVHVRQERNLSQAAFARRLEVHQSTISKIEKGIHRPRPKLTKRLEQLTQKKLQDLIRLVREVE